MPLILPIEGNTRGKDTEVAPYIQPSAESLTGLSAEDLSQVGTGLLTLDDITDWFKGRQPGESDVWRGFNLGDILPESVVDFFNSGLKGLDNLIKVLTPILKLLELFLTAFNSFSKILKSLVNFVQSEVNKWTDNLGNAGLFMNVIIPPAFKKDLEGNAVFSQLATGGFPGFMARLRASLANTADPNRPQFGPDSEVGGFIILLDAETTDDFWSGMKSLNELFSLDLFPINTDPPPPSSLVGYMGLFLTPEGEADEAAVQIFNEEWLQKQKTDAKDLLLQNGSIRFGAKIEWDAPSIPSPAFKIYRSPKSGGTKAEISDPPSKIAGKDGLIRAIGNMLANKKLEWPKRAAMVYEDTPHFDPVVVEKNFAGGGAIIDFGVIDPNTGTYPSGTGAYYYVVRSMTGFGFEGENSPELKIIVKTCRDPGDTPVVIHESEDGSTENFELISSGSGSVGDWSSVRAKLLLPFLPKVVDILNKLMNSVKGMIKDVSSSFGDFIRRLQEKIQTYITILGVLKLLIDRLKQILIGPSVSFLSVPPEPGGVTNFLNRVQGATPPTDRGFSGANGYTMGIVLMFGNSLVSPFGDTDPSTIGAEVEAVKKALNIIISFLTE